MLIGGTTSLRAGRSRAQHCATTQEVRPRTGGCMIRFPEWAERMRSGHAAAATARWHPDRSGAVGAWES
jgi:hypothetical protein